MRSAAHVDALFEVFHGRAHPITGSAVMSAKIAVTGKLLSEYISRLSGNINFQTWLTAAQTQNRLILRPRADAPKKISSSTCAEADYLAASYFSGGNIFIANSSCQSINLQELTDIGVIQHAVENEISGHLGGDNPISTINLQSNGSVEPSILDRFFLAEDEVVVYDKYINTLSMNLIEHIAKLLPDNASLKVFTSTLGKTCLKPNNILNKIKLVNNKIQASCAEVSVPFRKLAHDRYIFCGNRIQMVFTVGLDSFGSIGSDGKRRNRKSKISIYALDDTNHLNIEDIQGNIQPVNHLVGDIF